MHILCHRCGVTLTPGKGDFFVVRIDAVADPSPPAITAADLAGDTGETIEELLRQMEHLSERELMDMVHRRVVIHLCGGCYRVWIENPADPAGKPGQSGSRTSPKPSK